MVLAFDREFDFIGLFSLSKHEHNTSMLAAPLNGSLKYAHGFMIISESLPTACPVLDPSKFHNGSSLRLSIFVPVISNVRAFDLNLPHPSIQIYSAIISIIDFN